MQFRLPLLRGEPSGTAAGDAAEREGDGGRADEDAANGLRRQAAATAPVSEASGRIDAIAPRDAERRWGTDAGAEFFRGGGGGDARSGTGSISVFQNRAGDQRDGTG